MSIFPEKQDYIMDKRDGWRLDSSVFQAAATYASRLTLPFPRGVVNISLGEDFLRENHMGEEERDIPEDSLIIWTDKAEGGWLDTGYAAGQIAFYLHFHGVYAQIPRGIFSKAMEERGFCAAQMKLSPTPTGHTLLRNRRKGMREYPWMCHERHANWGKEVVEFAREYYAGISRCIQIQVGDDCICLNSKGGSLNQQDRILFELGVSMAKLTAAAEELWIDLRTVPVDSAAQMNVYAQKGIRGQSVYLCRYSDLEKVTKRYLQSGQTAALQRGKAAAKHQKRKSWGFA